MKSKQCFEGCTCRQLKKCGLMSVQIIAHHRRVSSTSPESAYMRCSPEQAGSHLSNSALQLGLLSLDVVDASDECVRTDVCVLPDLVHTLAGQTLKPGARVFCLLALVVRRQHQLLDAICPHLRKNGPTTPRSVGDTLNATTIREKIPVRSRMNRAHIVDQRTADYIDLA